MQTSTTYLNPILLNDAQVRQFLIDGYLILKPTVPNDTHEIIDQKFNWLLEHEPNPGNNILPRLPELNLILESPEVRGAMISLLGEDYVVHSHRYWHYLSPSDLDPDDHEATWKQVQSQGHQDSYSPSGQPKCHYMRYARFMYYSHEVEQVHGPTHVIPGSQYHAALTDEDRARAIPVAGRAGTVFISHFDLGHAAGVNFSDRVRNMIKFIFMRGAEPRQPTWNCRSTAFQKPAHRAAPYDLEAAWRHHWFWLCGKSSTADSGPIRSAADALATLASEDIHERLQALNALAACGPPPRRRAALHRRPEWSGTAPQRRRRPA